MQFASALSQHAELDAALATAGAQARERLGDHPVDLCVLFVSASFGSDLERAPVLAMEQLQPGRLVGCSGGGIIGGGSEVEGRRAVSVTLASLPDVELHALHLQDGDLPDADAPPSAWTELLGVPPAASAGFVVLPEPFTFAADRLLAGLDFAYPHAPKVGGMASGSNHPGGHALFLDRTCHKTGAVALGFSGNIVVETMVAQGCRPFGKVGRITSAENNYLIAIDGKPAVDFLQEQIQGLEGRELELVRQVPLFLGIAMDPFASDHPGPGDFLIRNVMGFDPTSRILSIGEILSVGRYVQFHLRDKHTSADDLRAVLQRAHERPGPEGALLFSCLGRGEHLYGEPDHDSRVFTEVVGDVPLGGFFCNGEIGPVHGTTYLHGYTSSFGLFRSKR